jgi:hypothetical protein
MTYTFPVGAVEINIIQCNECNGRGRLLTHWGINLAEILKVIPKMADESRIRQEEVSLKSEETESRSSEE